MGVGVVRQEAEGYEVGLPASTPEGSSSMEVAVRPNCVASGIERGAVGDLFLAYVSNDGTSTGPGFIALSRIVEPRTLEALASAMHD